MQKSENTGVITMELIIIIKSLRTSPQLKEKKKKMFTKLKGFN